MRATTLLDRLVPAGLVILGVMLAGCGRTTQSIAPASDDLTASALRAGPERTNDPAEAGPPANLYYPLEVGNHWGYEFAFTIDIVPMGGVPEAVSDMLERRDRDLVCVEQRAGRSYVVERQSYPSGQGWLRYRQDAAGLYEFDGDSDVPPVCAAATGRRTFDADGPGVGPEEAAWEGVAAKLADPVSRAAYRVAWDRIQARVQAIRRALGTGPAIPRGAASAGVEPGEIVRLAYPLHRGAHWAIRPDPLFASTVEGVDVLDLAVGRVPGWRIRIDSEFFGPADRVHLWYGRDGYLMLAAHLEGAATSPDGVTIGTMIAEEREVLVELSLARGRFAAR